MLMLAVSGDDFRFMFGPKRVRVELEQNAAMMDEGDGGKDNGTSVDRCKSSWGGGHFKSCCCHPRQVGQRLVVIHGWPWNGRLPADVMHSQSYFHNIFRNTPDAAVLGT